MTVQGSAQAQAILDQVLRYLACWTYETLRPANVRSLTNAVLQCQPERLNNEDLIWVHAMASRAVDDRTLPILGLDEMACTDERYTYGSYGI